MIIETGFTPWISLGGGILIGISATLLMLSIGRIMGIAGILGGLFQPASTHDFAWRAALLAGIVTSPLLVWIASGAFPPVQIPTSLPMLLIGGFIVGVGTTYGSGCTSGHGVCGMARGSVRSILATASFMIAAFSTVYLVRHVVGG